MRWRRMGLAVVGALLGLVLMGQATGIRADDASQPFTTNMAGTGYVYLFDSENEEFIFTFTLPMLDANPRDVDVVTQGSVQEVWFTEPGADRIGRLVYTDTEHTSYQAYDVGPGCSPLNLEVDGQWVWFTAPGCDQIGRLSRQTQSTDTFDITPAGTYPADLAIAGDGSVWFTQMQADQLAHLVVTSTVDYQLTTYQDDLLDGGRPYGIALAQQGVYIAQTMNDKVSKYTPATGLWLNVSLPGMDNLENPYKLTVGNEGAVWGTEMSGNRVTRFTYGTFAVLASYDLEPAGSSPMALAAGAADRLWFTQWGAGQIGRLATKAETLSYYPLPMDRLAPSGVVVEDQNVWVVATKPYVVYLPLIVRFWG